MVDAVARCCDGRRVAAPVTTARYARWDGVGAPFRLVETQIPEPAPDEILVAVDLATVCGSDLHTVRGRRSSPVPAVLGHEQVGRVVAAAPGVRHLGGTPVRTGDRVVFSVAASCGRCARCRRGIPQKCTDLHKYGHAPLDESRPLTGGFATHCLLAPGTATVVVPAAVPDAVAAPASCATATVAAVLDAAGPLGPGDRVLVTGAGMLGVTASATAARAGAEVTVADPHPDRRDRALRFGAVRAVEMPAQRSFDVALELSGSPAAVRTCLDALDVGGTAVLAGSVAPGPEVGLDPEQLVRGLNTVVGVHNYAPRHLAAAVEFLAAEHARYPFADLIGGPWPLHAIDDAVTAAGRPGAAPRQGVRP